MLSRLLNNAGKTHAAEANERVIFRCVVLAILMLISSPLMAKDSLRNKIIQFDIPQQRADKSLIEFAEQADLTLIVPFDEVREITVNRLVGKYPIKEALKTLLSGTGLKATVGDSIRITIVSDQDQGKTMLIKKPATFGQRVAVAFLSIFGATQVTGAVDAVEPDGVYEQSATIEEVIVTATKTGETNLQDTPLSITAFSESSLANLHVNSITDLAQFVPNANFAVFGPGVLQGIIRGIGPNSGIGFSNDQNIGFYLDGVLLQYGIGANTNFLDVERIEVVRGPQGTLYGRNSTGGAVNIVTKRPSDEIELKIRAQVGNYNMREFDGTISGPIIKDKLKARLSFSDSAHDGYMDNLTGPDIFDDDHTSVRGTIEWTPTDKVDIALSGDYYHGESRGQSNRLISNVGVVPALAAAAGFPESMWNSDDFWTTAQNTEAANEVKSSGLSASVQVQLPRNQSLLSITSFRKAKRAYIEDVDGTPLSFFDASGDFRNETVTQELQFNGSQGRWNWLMGFYYLHDDEEAKIPNVFHFVMPNLVVTRGSRIKTDAWAIFGSLSYALTDKLSVDAGLRYSNEKKDVLHAGQYTEPNFPPLNNSQTPDSESWDDVTPKFGLQYRITDDALLYGSVSKGFKSGAYAQTNPTGQKWVDPESLWAYEIGFKTDLLDNRLRINGAVFYYDYTDLQVRAWTMDGTLVKNAAVSTVKGVELEFLAKPTPALTLNSSISYLDAKYDEFVTVDSRRQPFDASGNPLTSAPEWKFVLGAQYQIPVGDYGFFTFRGDLSWIDNQYFSPFKDPLASQTSYTLLSGLVRFETTGGHWTAEFFGKNLGEEEYIVSAIGPFLGSYIGNIGSPRTFGLQVTYQY